MESDQLFFSFMGMFWLILEHFSQTDWLILSRNFPKRQVIGSFFPVLETVLSSLPFRGLGDQLQEEQLGNLTLSMVL